MNTVVNSIMTNDQGRLFIYISREREMFFLIFVSMKWAFYIRGILSIGKREAFRERILWQAVL